MTQATSQPAITETKAAFTFNAALQRYRDTATGRYLSATTVRAALDSFIDGTAQATTRLAEQLVAGNISLASWQEGMARNIKLGHIAAALAGAGGVNNMGPAEYGFTGSLIKKQYEYLREFAAQVASGKQSIDGSLVARANLYDQSARGTYHELQRRGNKSAGFTSERRVLGISDHCSGVNGCIESAALGWQPIGTLPAIGDSPCLSNCHCEFIFGT